MIPLLKSAGPEAELMFRAARLAPDAEDLERIESLLSGPLDWSSFFETVERNHVAPAINRTFQTHELTALPAKVAETLRVRTKITTWKNRRFADELVRLDAAFRQSGLEVLHYKGPAAAARLYGDISLRTFNDFDFLVKRDQLQDLLACMRRHGYRNARILSTEESEYSERQFKEYLYVREDFRVEPHWSLTARRYPFAIDYPGLWQRSTRFDLGDGSLSVLAPEDECHVLCIVGAKGWWKRYQMVTDIAQCLNAFPQLDWQQLLADARAAGSERAVLLGIALAVELAGARVPSVVWRQVENSRAVRRLACRFALSFSGPPKTNAFLPDGPHILRSDLFLMRERVQDRLTYLWRTTTTPTITHRRLFRLPGRLRWLYVPLVPVYDYLAYPLLSAARRWVSGSASPISGRAHQGNL